MICEYVNWTEISLNMFKWQEFCDHGNEPSGLIRVGNFLTNCSRKTLDHGVSCCHQLPHVYHASQIKIVTFSYILQTARIQPLGCHTLFSQTNSSCSVMCKSIWLKKVQFLHECMSRAEYMCKTLLSHSHKI
jgi:hypothetical protein